MDIVIKCLFTFSLDPEYLLMDYECMKDTIYDPLFNTIIECIGSFNLRIQKAAFTFCWAFLEKASFAVFEPIDFKNNPYHKTVTLFTQLGAIAQLLVQKVSNNDLGETMILEHLGLAKAFLQGRCHLAERYEFPSETDNEITKIEKAPVRFEISNVIERSMLILLLSSNTKICKLALEILHTMVQEATICENLDEPEFSSWSIMSNFSLYSELSSPNFILTGAIAVHKRLYKYLQTANSNTLAIVEAWKILNLKWKVLTQILKKGNPIDYNIAKKWRAYSGFLGSTVSEWVVNEDETPIERKLSKLSKEFLLETLSLLTNVSSSYLRETAREILSRDISPFAYHFIFITLEEKLKRLSQDQLKLSEKGFLLLEQSVLFLRAIIEFTNDGQVYLAVDIASLALSIVKKLDGLKLTERVLKLRILYAGLVTRISKHKDSMNLKHDLEIRNEVALIFCSWLDHSILHKYGDEDTISVKSYDTNPSDRRAQSDKESLHKDCIVALVESLASVTLKLTIQVPYRTHEKDIQDIKVKNFSVIFTLLVRVLERCCFEESKLQGSLDLGDRLEIVRNKAIESLSKLLDANVDVGLKMAFPFAMHEDAFIRVSFIKILDNILSHSSGFKSSSSVSETYEVLSNFLVENINVAVSLCNVCPATEVDEFSTAILSVFENKDRSLMLVKTVVTREVERADTPMEMLRRNCAATKILSIYAHSKGLAYLHAALGPFIREIIASPDEYTFETNPEKIPENDTVEENIAKFKKTLNKLLNVLESAMNYIPFLFREICNTIAVTADARYVGKNASVNALSAFFFLRFVCPSLVTPESDILSDGPPSQQVKRTLLILAKMIQNLAYGSGSFVKLSIFKNKDITFEEESATVLRILQRLTDTSDAVTYGGSIFTEEKFKEPSTFDRGNVVKVLDVPYLEAIHRFLYNHWEDINHRLQTEARIKKHTYFSKPNTLAGKHSTLADSRNGSSQSLSSGSEEESDFRVSQKLTLIVRNLGRPKIPEAKTNNEFDIPNAPSFAPRLREFLERNSHRDMNAIIERHIVHEGMSKDGMPLLILTSRNYVRDELDTELVVCRFFQVVSKIMYQKFCLFYDGTGMSSENLLPTSANAVISSLAPDLLAKNCVGAYLYNVPNDMVQALQTSFAPYQSGKYLSLAYTSYTVLSSHDIEKQFNLEVLNLDTISYVVAKDIRVDFQEIALVDTETKKRQAVTLRLGNEFLQIQIDNNLSLAPGISGPTNSVFHLSDITRIEVSDSHPGDFLVIISRTRRFVFHASTKAHANEISRSITNAQARLPKASYKFNTNGETQLYQTLESSLGSLLNVSFSSMCSSDPLSKSAAYNLLATIQSRFKLELAGVDLVRGHGIKLPANIFARVQKYSTSIANTRPELTFDMVQEMFPAFKAMSHDSRQGALMYIAPWVKGLSPNVYSREPDGYKRGTTAHLIRQFLELSLRNDRDYMYMLQGVWPLIMAQHDLLPLLIDEILAFVLESNLIGSLASRKMDNVIAILTAYQSKEACEAIVKRILEIATEAEYFKDNSLVNHTQWQEIIVLFSILSPMLFENPEAAIKYCAEFCFIVEMFLYTGPHSFRLSLYNLVVNMLHSFLYNGGISGESLVHITALWKELSSSKGNMIFGISDEMKNVSYDFPVTNIMFQIEACSTVLLELARCVSKGNQLEMYHNRFTQLCVQLSTHSRSILQSRALVALGCDNRVDVADKTVETVLGVFYDILNSADNKVRIELITCCAFCISRLANGLRVNSKYHGYLFWIALALLNTQNITIFGYGLHLLQTVTKSLEDYGVFKQMPMSSYLISCKEEFKDQWARVERALDVSFSHQNFELGLSCLLLGGMVKSITRAATMAALDTLLTISARNHRYREGPLTSDSIHSVCVDENLTVISSASSALNGSLANRLYKNPTSGKSSGVNSHVIGSPVISPVGVVGDFDIADDSSASSFTQTKNYPPHMVYLFFLYLGARSQSDLRDYLWIAGYPEDQITGQGVPVPIQKFLTNGSAATVALYLGALVFNESDDIEVLGQRYLQVLKFVGTVNLSDFIRIYCVIQPKVKNVIDVGPTMDTVKVALECAKTALINYQEFQKSDKYLSELDEILVKGGIGPAKSATISAQKYLEKDNKGVVVSDNVFFQDKLVSVASVGHTGSGIVAIGASPVIHSAHDSNHVLSATITQSTVDSNTGSPLFDTNLGSTFSGNTSVLRQSNSRKQSLSQQYQSPKLGRYPSLSSASSSTSIAAGAANYAARSTSAGPNGGFQKSQVASSASNSVSNFEQRVDEDEGSWKLTFADQQLCGLIDRLIHVAKTPSMKSSNAASNGNNSSGTELQGLMIQNLGLQSGAAAQEPAQLSSFSSSLSSPGSPTSSESPSATKTGTATGATGTSAPVSEELPSPLRTSISTGGFIFSDPDPEIINLHSLRLFNSDSDNNNITTTTTTTTTNTNQQQQPTVKSWQQRKLDKMRVQPSFSYGVDDIFQDEDDDE